MKLNILYGCDDNYAPYTGISMTSLFENNRDIEEITVYFAAMDCSRENLDKFQSITESYGRRLVILNTEEAVNEIRSHQCGTWNGSLAPWLRFFVLNQIPADVTRLVWIDSDTIVNHGVADIVSELPEQAPVAAACDCLAHWQRYRLGIHQDEPYYNSGVIVFNLDYWRKNHIVDQLMENLNKNHVRYIAPDQDMMNDFFRKQIQTLPAKYNAQCFLMAYSVRDYYSAFPWHRDAFYSQTELSEALKNPVIVHFFRFLGDYPWTRGKNYHPAKALYEEWKSKSLWKDHPGAEGKKDLSFKAEKTLYCLLPRGVFLKFFVWYTNRTMPKEPVS